MMMTANLIPLLEHALDFSFPLDNGLTFSLVLGYNGLLLAQSRGRVFIPAHVLRGLFSSSLV